MIYDLTDLLLEKHGAINKFWVVSIVAADALVL